MSKFELPAVFHNERMERRLLALELRVIAFQNTVVATLDTLCNTVNHNAQATELLARSMQIQGEALPGEHPLTSNARRGGH